jgi:hypothetical protein
MTDFESGTEEHFGFSTGVTTVDINYDGWQLFLKGDGKGNFRSVPATESGLLIGGDVREICNITLGKSKIRGIIAAKNNNFLQIVNIIEKTYGK